MISPPGAYHNDKCVMINPPGAYHNGGVNENLTPGKQNVSLETCKMEDQIDDELKVNLAYNFN